MLQKFFPAHNPTNFLLSLLRAENEERNAKEGKDGSGGVTNNPGLQNRLQGGGGGDSGSSSSGYYSSKSGGMSGYRADQDGYRNRTGSASRSSSGYGRSSGYSSGINGSDG